MTEELARNFTAPDALVAIMITMSVSDEAIRTSELLTIQQIVNHLPIFSEYDAERISGVAETVFDLLEEEEGIDAILGLVKHAVPETHYETVYALACDVAAADGRLRQTELEMLREIRYELELDPLHAAAIERGARARHLTL